MLVEEAEEESAELFGLLDVRGVAAVEQRFFAVCPAPRGVFGEYRPNLGDHRLWGVCFLARPPRHYA